MEQVIKIDIFFFVTTLAVGLITIFIAIALIYVVRILQDFRYISKRLKDGTQGVVSTIESINSFVEEEKSSIKKALSFFNIKKKSKKNKSAKGRKTKKN